MRPRFVLTLSLLALLVLGGTLVLKKSLGSKSTPPTDEPITVTAAPAIDSNEMAQAAPPPEPVPATAQIAAAPTNTLTPEQREAAIDAEIDRLQQLSANDDAASLSNILADLTDPEKEVREAAIEATKQFGSTNAIPALKAAANNTDDLQEKNDLLEAADFLALPSISELSSQFPPLTPDQIRANQQRKTQIQNRLHGKSQPPASPVAPGQNQP